MSESTYEKKKDKKPGLYTQWFLQLNTDGSKLPSQMKELRQLCLEECSSRASHTWPVPLSSPSHLSVPTVAAKYPDKILVVIIVTIVNRIVNTCWGSADLWVRNTVLLVVGLMTFWNQAGCIHLLSSFLLHCPLSCPERHKDKGLSTVLQVLSLLVISNVPIPLLLGALLPSSPIITHRDVLWLIIACP